MTKIYDCFIFNDENEILELRLNELKNYVDIHVIIEFGENHQGKQKGRKINQQILDKFKDKIRYFYYDKFELVNTWKRESFQRNKIFEGIIDASDEDIIIISDVDEIPNLSRINIKEIDNFVYAFSQTHSMYKFNIVREKKWIGSKLCKKKILKSPQWLRSLKVHKKYSFLRLDKMFSKTYYKNFKIIYDGGWHFGWLKSPKEIVNKINAYAHEEHNTLLNNDINYIIECIDKNLSFLDHNDKLIFQDNLNFLPSYIINNEYKYLKWIKKK